MAAVEDAFRQHALGKAPPPGILSLHAEDGGFHIKAALLTLDRPYFAAKTNANFPHNGARHGLPTIQGVVVRHALREMQRLSPAEGHLRLAGRGISRGG